MTIDLKDFRSFFFILFSLRLTLFFRFLRPKFCLPTRPETPCCSVPRGQFSARVSTDVFINFTNHKRFARLPPRNFYRSSYLFDFFFFTVRPVNAIRSVGPAENGKYLRSFVFFGEFGLRPNAFKPKKHVGNVRIQTWCLCVRIIFKEKPSQKKSPMIQYRYSCVTV